MKWHRVFEPSEVGFLGFLILMVLGLFLSLFSVFNIFFFFVGVVGVYIFYPTKLKRKIIKFIRLIGVVSESMMYNGYTFYLHWPKVYYAYNDNFFYLKLQEVSISSSVSLDRICQEIFGLQLIEKKSDFGFYILKMGAAPRKENYNWNETC